VEKKDAFMFPADASLVACSVNVNLELFPRFRSDICQDQELQESRVSSEVLHGREMLHN